MLAAFVIAIVLIALCIAGIVLLAKVLSWDGLFALKSITRGLYGFGLLGIGIGGGALLLMALDYAVRLLGRFARLHYTLLNKAEQSA